MEQPWYKDGLRFECQRCGSCCSGVPGSVWISEDEILPIARHLDMDVSVFRQRYIIEKSKKGLQVAQRQNDDCVFYNRASGCVIYKFRPLQCRTWPFWKCNVVKYKKWVETSRTCPGIDQGRCYTVDQIENLTKKDGIPRR